jgi:8-oxo-dGTP pyrophosphatase MutT (NUDIX family)
MTEANQNLQVAIAILFQNDRFLLQLRDNIPTILYPGYWAFFGGHIEPDETDEEGIWRELQEEIGYAPPWLKLFTQWEDDQIKRYVYFGPLDVPVEQLELNEGWDLGLWTVEDIYRGDRYSERAQEVRPLGKPHQQILMNFLDYYGEHVRRPKLLQA